MKANISPSFLTPQQDRLLKFVILMHGEQKRKYTNEPYWYHVVNVAYRADIVAGRLGIEIGLSHDLIEDTDCTPLLLHEYLVAIGYEACDALEIMNGVVELTDVFTSEAFPNLKREERKALEAHRLGTISVRSQNVKYCDLEDNSSSILEHDPSFAKVYLAEKAEMLQYMVAGDQTLRKLLLESIKHD
jgi:(p)ppGpp synthase/HD superfamily hydrolase